MAHAEARKMAPIMHRCPVPIMATMGWVGPRAAASAWLVLSHRHFMPLLLTCTQLHAMASNVRICSPVGTSAWACTSALAPAWASATCFLASVSLLLSV